MSDSRQRLADHFEAGETDLELLLRARDRDEIARLMRRLLQWRRELIALAKDHDPVALHFQNVDPTPQETVRIHRWYPQLRDSQQRVCNYVETALVRLNAYLRQPDSRPKGKGGNRRRADYGPILAKARAIKKAKNLKSNAAAVREAAEKFPKLVLGDSDNENVIKYIASKM